MASFAGQYCVYTGKGLKKKKVCKVTGKTKCTAFFMNRILKGNFLLAGIKHDGQKSFNAVMSTIRVLYF